jgi:FMN phosphatase YigB (HAD superfamily)
LPPVIQELMTKISAIIFDLGGVLLDLDQERTIRTFARLGVDLEELNTRSTIFNDFETGKIAAADFRQGIKSVLKGEITDEQIDQAWNAMLLETNAERFEIIGALRSRFKTYLLSNTNSIHIDSFHQYLDRFSGLNTWNTLFDKQFLSYEIGLRKPGKEIYQYVLDAIGCKGNECLFIDDSVPNLHGAEVAGIHTLHAKKPLDADLLKEIKRITG